MHGRAEVSFGFPVRSSSAQSQLLSLYPGRLQASSLRIHNTCILVPVMPYFFESSFSEVLSEVNVPSFLPAG